jgi:8-amino-7-oxononanoate synthase
MDHLIDFSSNDYLGLARNEDLKAYLRTQEGTEDYLLGGTGSRLISGQHLAYQDCEIYLSEVFEAEKVLMYNSGYAANQGVVASIPQRGDTVLYDQLAHVCLKEGAWLSNAESMSFKHNDVADLERKLKRAPGEKYIVTETIFSMDGDVAPVEEILGLCTKYGAWLIVDEAHSTGVYGKNGGGMLLEQELHRNVLARIYTFGKGIGMHGAAVAANAEVIDYLINFSRTFIYTTSLPPRTIKEIQGAFEFLSKHPEIQEELNKRISLFREQYPESISNTAIQPVLIPGNDKARTAAVSLQERGFDVRPILSPTVKEGAERLRVSLHVHNTEEQIKTLAAALHSLRSHS